MQEEILTPNNPKNFKNWIWLIIIILIIIIAIFIYIKIRSEGKTETQITQSIQTTSTTSITISLENCLKQASTISDIDNCYIAEAGKTNLDQFCDDVSQTKKQDCYDQITPETSNLEQIPNTELP